MRRPGFAVSAFALLWALAMALSGCGGGGSGGGAVAGEKGGTSEDTPGGTPLLGNLRLQPDRIVENGDNAANVMGTFAFSDEGGNVCACAVEVLDPSGARVSSRTYPLRNVSGLRSGFTTVTFRVPTARPGTFTVRVNVTDLFGRVSNSLTGVFDVVERSALAYPWTTAAPMPTARVGLGAGAMGGKLYAVGGEDANDLRNVVECYDPTTNKWTTRNPMPTPRSRFASLVMNDKMYVMGGIGRIASGGRGETAVVELYDPATDTWTTRAAMPAAQWDFGAVAIDGRIYAIGGAMPGAGMMMYDPGTDTWSVLPPPVRNAAFAAGAIGDKLYVAGGMDGGIVSTLEQYDPATNKWVEKSAMPTARAYSASAVVDGRMYVMGGMSGETTYTDTVHDTMESHDPATGTWTRGTPMPTARSHAASGVVDGKIYVIGGYEAYLSRPGNRLEVYDPAADQL